MKKLFVCIVLFIMFMFPREARPEDQARIQQLQNEYRIFLAQELDLQERLETIQRDKQRTVGRILERELVRKEKTREAARAKREAKKEAEKKDKENAKSTP